MRSAGGWAEARNVVELQRAERCDVPFGLDLGDGVSAKETAAQTTCGDCADGAGRSAMHTGGLGDAKKWQSWAQIARKVDV